jgi:protein-tyrosine phosphatase
MGSQAGKLSTGGLRVITVCTGNICRSPMAQAVIQAAVRGTELASLPVVVESAGTHGYHVGEDADPRARAVLADAGYPLHHRARKFDPKWLREADLILAMDRGHMAALRELADRSGAPTRNLALMRTFDPDADDLDVPDPYYDSLGAFRHVLAMLERATPGVITELRRLAAGGIRSGAGVGPSQAGQRRVTSPSAEHPHR